MEIKLFYDDKHKPMARVKDKVYHASELSFALILLDEKQLKEQFGDTQPSIVIEGESDDVLDKAKIDYDAMLTTLYNK